MITTETYYIAKPAKGEKAAFWDESIAKKFAGEGGSVVPATGVKVFNTIAEHNTYARDKFSLEIVPCLSLSIPLSESGKIILFNLGQEKGKRHIKELLSTPLNDLDVTVRTYNILKKCNCEFLKDVLAFAHDAHSVISYQNAGKKTVADLEKLFNYYGLSYGMFEKEKK